MTGGRSSELTAPISILLFNSGSIAGEGIRLILERERGMSVIGLASSLEEINPEPPAPQVVVADAAGDGHGRLAQVRDRLPKAGLVVVEKIATAARVQKALATGASGFLLLDASVQELREAVHSAAEGRRYIQPSLAASIALDGDRPQPNGNGRGGLLTNREMEVLRLLVLGHTNTEVSVILGIAVRTGEKHRANLTRKLGLRTRAELVRYALDRELIKVTRFDAH